MPFTLSKTTRRVAAAATAVAAAGLQAACGQSTTPSSAPAAASSSQADSAVPGKHNMQDVMFAQQMIPHHKQAIAMAEVVLEKSSSQQIKELAKAIKQAQGPEIQKMKKWLEAWGAPAMPSGSMNHGDGHGKGMMSQAEMAKFKQADGKKLNRMFLQMMIRHHKGAIAMARTELEQGQNPQAKQLAKAIIEAQQAEIDQMRRMLKN